LPEFQHVICANARWESRYIAEWLRYYQRLGFDHVFLYCNDDTPDEMAQAAAPFMVGEKPFVTFRHHGVQGEQFRMYRHFLQTDAQRCGWIGFFDIDEFLRLKPGQTIGDFMRDFQDVDCVLFNWLFFGTSGHKTPPPGSVLENYLYREDAIHCLTKFLARPALFTDQRFFDESVEHWYMHWPGYVLGEAFTPVNVLHESMHGYYDGFPARPGEWVNRPERRQKIIDTAVIHHYSFRSEQNFFDRVARGTGGDYRHQANWKNVALGEEFPNFLAGINAVYDDALANFWSQAEAVPAKIAVVAVVRDEAQSIAEWLAWQLAVGFDAVILLDNASTDATRRIAQSFAGAHDIRILDWRVTTPDYQMRGYEHAARTLENEFAWLAFFDADEFLVLPEHLDLRACLARSEAAAVAIPWAIFGASGHHEQPSSLITETFLHRAPEHFLPNRHVKSIIRPTLMRAALNPHVFEMQGGYADLTGAPLAFSSPGLLAENPDYAAGKLHHYFVQSWSHWQDKLRRGYHDILRAEAEFFVYDQNEIFDDSAKRLVNSVKTILTARERQKTETCAVVLVVKNEASDITAWLGWHHALGFDACIVYDDDSDDGTWEILQHAARHQRIFLARTSGDKSIRYEHRQDAAYRHALTTYADAFDWLAFFDADEFLLLNQDATVQDFLARFPAADAVAINWCNYGSSGHLLKPEFAPFDAYTWHGDENQPINRHVKSIVRPKLVGPNWLNVHCFDVRYERIFLANGHRAGWGPALGILAFNPDWTVAKLMHYQCRSMEHFIERMKKRPELAVLPNVWAGYDVHEVQSFVPGPIAAAARAQMDKIKPPAAPAGRAVPDLIFDLGMSEGNDTAFYLAKKFRVIGVEPDVAMFAQLSERFADDIAAQNLKIYNCAASEHAGEITEFFHHHQYQGISSLCNTRTEFAEGSYTAYKVLTIDWHSLTAKHGVPYYAKIDIERHEREFLRGMAGALILPPYISVECFWFEAIERLQSLGYRAFQLIDQNPPGGFALPAIQREGAAITWSAWDHTSGPFGRDLPENNWLSFEDFKTLWQKIRPDQAATWYDCHARLTPP
jgi:FkbM family methyltransferase